MIKRHYHKHYKARYQERAHLVFLLDAILVSIALALLGLSLYFRWFYHPLRDDFRISLLSEQTITAGRETTLSVRIVNSGKTALHGAKLMVRLPEAFVPSEDGAERNRTVVIGDLPAHASHEARFTGVPFGSPQASTVYVQFMATNDEGHSDEKLMKGIIHWEKNAVQLRFEMPEAVIPGQTAAFKLRVKNDSAFDFENAAVVPVWPTGFRVLQATPPVYRGTIALGTLEAGEEVELALVGRYSNERPVDGLNVSDFTATLKADFMGSAHAIATAYAHVPMADAGLKLEARFAEPVPTYLHAGIEVPVIVSYRNSGAQTMHDLQLSIAPDPRALGNVRWETDSSIGDLAPGQSGERTAFVRVLDVISRYAVNPVLHAVPQATFSIDEPRVSGVQVIGLSVETKVAGAVRLRTIARFFTSEGDQIGRGPLPPKVGKTTRYWIFASLETGGSQVQDGLATFRLPAGVAWTGRATVTAGDELKLEGDRLVWRLGTTDAHAGLLLEAPSASFEVALTPASDQAGTSPLLLAEASYSGQDTWTGVALTASGPGLTTQLPGDPAVAGRTTVMP